jgi:polysaccharide biosynthesis transport protein
MEEEPKAFKDYLGALKRRKRQIVLTALVVFAIGLSVALLLPPSYKSTATILIEQQEIPVDLVRSTISSYADQRIQVISQQVMTRSNLMRIIEKFDLYPKLRRAKTMEEVLERMSKDIKLDILKADVIDQRSGAKTAATIAFSLSYSGETPLGAQKVANELVTLFLSENLKAREQKTAETSSFLAEEAARLSRQVADIESRLAQFKARNIGRLPELVTLNMQMRDRTDNELREVDRQLAALEERKFYLDGQLAQIKPNTPLMSVGGERILDANERLRSLQAVYASASGVYSANHPDVVKMKREIAALKKETGSASDTDEQAKQLVKLKADLAAARERYSADHPDVVRITRAIAALEADQRAAPAATATAALKPENPAYIAVQTQLEATVAEQRTLRVKRKQLESKMAMYEQRVEQSPQVEREYRDLARDHETSMLRYREIRNKQMQAEVGQELEKDRKGERFSLIDPPQLPEQPSSPNRPAIVLLGFVLALGSGLGSATLSENLDGSVRGVKALENLAGVPVLAAIPVVTTMGDRMRHRRRVRTAAVASLVAFALALTAVHALWMPLDVLWYRSLRGIETVMPGLAHAIPSTSTIGT